MYIAIAIQVLLVFLAPLTGQSPKLMNQFVGIACQEMGRLADRGSDHKQYSCELQSSDELFTYVQIRNKRPRGASGLIANVRINNKDLLVEEDIDEVNRKVITSEKLHRISINLMKKKTALRL
jgi:hypothetical protein